MRLASAGSSRLRRVLLFRANIAVSLAWAPAVAAAPETEADRAELSEQLLQQGREAFESKRYKEAHERLSKAYRLLQSYRTACALGQVELELSLYRDAAEHLDTCVSRYPADDPQQARDRVLDGLRETRRHVAVFEPLVNARGATILINGVEVSTTPLDADLFVEPGLRRVTARKAGYHDVSAELFFPAGGTIQWQAALVPQSPERPANDPGFGNVYLGIGTALTAVTLAGGIALSVIAHTEEVRARRAVSKLEDPGTCTPASSESACKAARSQLDAATESSDLAAATLWAGAGLGVLTVVVTWATSANDEPPSDGKPPSVAMRLQPLVYRGGAGATWIGRF